MKLAIKVIYRGPSNGEVGGAALYSRTSLWLVLAGANTTACGAQERSSHLEVIILVQNQTVKLIESVDSGTGTQSLANLTAVQVSSTFKVGANEGDFQMSRIHASARITNGPQTDTVGELERGNPMYLVLARGDMTAAQVTAALNGTLNVDLTPAGGTLNRVSIAQERGIILMEEFMFSGHLNDEGAGEYTDRWQARVNGPPLGNSLEQGRVRSYVFPKNIGWAWFVFNAGPALDAEGEFQFYARMTGRFLDD